MIVHFVRHGVTEHNRRSVHQPPEVALSPEGEVEAKRAGHYLRSAFASAPIDKIVTSDLDRAVKTADIIGSELGLAPQSSELFREIRRPSSLYGTSHFHPRTVWYVLATLLNRNKKDWHYKDAESLTEVHARAGEAERLLRELAAEHQNIVVVSHAIFLEILMQNLCKNGVLGFMDYIPIFSPFSVIKNASVTTFECHVGTGENLCAWERRAFNDVAHLHR